MLLIGKNMKYIQKNLEKEKNMYKITEIYILKIQKRNIYKVTAEKELNKK